MSGLHQAFLNWSTSKQQTPLLSLAPFLHYLLQFLKLLFSDLPVTAFTRELIRACPTAAVKRVCSKTAAECPLPQSDPSHQCRSIWKIHIMWGKKKKYWYLLWTGISKTKCIFRQEVTNTWNTPKNVMWTAFIHHILVPRLNPLMWYPVQDTYIYTNCPWTMFILSISINVLMTCQTFWTVFFFHPSGDKPDQTWSKIKVHLAPSPFSIFHCGSMSKQPVSKNIQNVFLFRISALLHHGSSEVDQKKKPQRQFDLF